jgi:hypothetical protein
MAINTKILWYSELWVCGSYNPKIEAAGSPETLLHIYQYEGRHMTEYRNVNINIVIMNYTEKDHGIASLFDH